MRLFVTGHTGFKGAWAIALFSRLGATISGYALAPPSRPSLFEEADLAPAIRHTIGDVRDAAALRAALRAAQPDAVLHMAAQSLVLEGLERPIETFETNVLGTANVLEAIRATPSVRACVVVTSDKCYVPSPHAMREEDPLGGDDPYSASKAAAEMVVAGYRRLMNERTIVATARAGNVVGGGDWSQRRLVADLARAMLSDGEIVLRHPHAVRPWQHVLDALSGYALLLDRALAGDTSVARAWNFGPEERGHQTVEDVVSAFAGAYGRPLRVRVEPCAAAENPALRLDASRARSELRWTPQFDAAGAVADAAAFYRARAGGESVAALLAQRVERYCGTAAAAGRLA